MSINDKQRAFINEYMINGHNATKAYKTAYPDAGTSAEFNASRLMSNDKIKAEIARKVAELAETNGHTRVDQLKKLDEAFDKAKSGNQPTAMVSATKAQNEMLGYIQDKAPNAEQAQAVAQRMTEQDRAIAVEVARILTDREASKGLRLAQDGRKPVKSA